MLLSLFSSCFSNYATSHPLFSIFPFCSLFFFLHEVVLYTYFWVLLLELLDHITFSSLIICCHGIRETLIKIKFPSNSQYFFFNILTFYYVHTVSDLCHIVNHFRQIPIWNCMRFLLIIMKLVDVQSMNIFLCDGLSESVCVKFYEHIYWNAGLAHQKWFSIFEDAHIPMKKKNNDSTNECVISHPPSSIIARFFFSILFQNYIISWRSWSYRHESWTVG